jgi:hypothetical protein
MHLMSIAKARKLPLSKRSLFLGVFGEGPTGVMGDARHDNGEGVLAAATVSMENPRAEPIAESGARTPAVAMAVC